MRNVIHVLRGGRVGGCGALFDASCLPPAAGGRCVGVESRLAWICCARRFMSVSSRPGSEKLLPQVVRAPAPGLILSALAHGPHDAMYIQIARFIAAVCHRVSGLRRYSLM